MLTSRPCRFACGRACLPWCCRIWRSPPQPWWAGPKRRRRRSRRGRASPRSGQAGADATPERRLRGGAVRRRPRCGSWPAAVPWSGPGLRSAPGRPAPVCAGSWAEAPRCRSRPGKAAWPTSLPHSLLRLSSSWPRSFLSTVQHREAQDLPGVVIGLSHAACERAHPQDVALAFRHGDGAARVQEVEGMGGLQHLLVGRQRQPLLQEARAFGFADVEPLEEFCSVGLLEVVPGLLHLVLVVDVAVGDLALRAVGPGELVHILYTLQVHGQALETVGDLTGDRLALEATHLLEVGELADLHAVQPHLPT